MTLRYVRWNDRLVDATEFPDMPSKVAPHPRPSAQHCPSSFHRHTLRSELHAREGLYKMRFRTGIANIALLHRELIQAQLCSTSPISSYPSHESATASPVRRVYADGRHHPLPLVPLPHMHHPTLTRGRALYHSQRGEQGRRASVVVRSSHALSSRCYR